MRALLLWTRGIRVAFGPVDDALCAKVQPGRRGPGRKPRVAARARGESGAAPWPPAAWRGQERVHGRRVQRRRGGEWGWDDDEESARVRMGCLMDVDEWTVAT